MGEVLVLDLDKVPVDPAVEYRLAGVFSFGRGLFRRNPLLGSQTSYSHLNRLATGQFVMSKLKAWEGAIAIVDESFDGYVLSPEFPTYTLDEQITPSFLRLATTQPHLWERLAAESRGVGGRKERVHQLALLNVSILLPPLAEQRRTVDLIAAVDGAIEAAEREAVVSSRASSILLSSYAKSVESQVRLGDVVSLRYGMALKEGDRAGGTVPVFGSAGRVGYHDKPSSTSSPRIVVGRKGAHALSTLPLQLRREDTVRGEYREVGGAGSVRWSSKEAWVIDTAYEAVAQSDFDARSIFWMLVFANLPSVATTTTLPGLSRAAAYARVVPDLTSDSAAPILDALDDFEETSVGALNLLAALRHLRSALLGDLLSGEHEIPASYDELLSA